MRILAIFHPDKAGLPEPPLRYGLPGRTGRKTQPGYTLLEMLVVLVILGLLVSMVTPRLIQLHRAVSLSSEKKAIYRQISTLGYKAHEQGRPVVLTNDPDTGQAPGELSLPPQWHIRVSGPISYNHNGFCSGGEITLQKDSYQKTHVLEPPFCSMVP
jgi:prepilin-type N-terminal cleavage/methylation domain-containing protein